MAESLTIARPYAKALHDVANAGNVQEWLAVMEVCQVLGDDETSKNLLQSPTLTAQKFSSILDKLFQSAKIDVVPTEFNRFIGLISDNRRFSLLPEIATLFINEVNKSNDKLIAEIVAAMPITDSSRDNLIKRLEQRYGKTVEASITIDKTLIGGAVIKIGDTVIDGSVKGRVEQLSKALN